MNIREWYSNSVKFISGLHQSDLGKDTSPKVLGLKWNTIKDTLSCSGITGETEPNTKRKILQAVAQVYDPCGWLTPVVIKGKILIQQLWKTNFDWDDTLPAEMTQQFKTIKHDLEELSSVEVPRYIEGFSGSDPIGYEIHVFCDASAKADASACYVRVLRSGEPPLSTLIFSKTRLAPIKPVSIPRLELMAVALGVRMVQFVAKELHICPSRRFIWTDSKCVLHWLISSKQYPVFVQNRINEIEQVEDISFRFVPTQCNPADLPTRGLDLMELQSLDLWWHGPHFLVLQEAFWPETVTPTDEPIQEVTSVALCAPPQPPEGIGCLIDPNNYSSFMKLVRVTAYVKRFISNCVRKTTDHNSTVLTKSQLGRAEQMWVRSEQRLMFPGGLQATKCSTTVIRLGLIEDDTGLIRCKGRLEHADLPEAAKQPLLLRKNSKVSDLIIDQCHKILLHGGDRQTLAQLRLKYWIPQGMSQVKRNRRKCYVCQKAEGGPFRMPESPPLPQFRVTRSLPFDHTGIDYLGPLFVKSTGEQNTSITKVWICLFTCAVIRAIHLEVVSDCTAEQFLMCLKRFSAIYGKPSSIISDNAKCFKATQSLLHEISRKDTVQPYSNAKGIQWHFIPELAPWMGGFYERLVQSVKKVLRKSLGNKCFNLIELQTLVTEVSSVVNSRPLVPVNSEDTEEVITPAHFLSKQGRMGLPDLEVDEDSQFTIDYISKARGDLLNTWLKGQRHMDSFWTCWRNEYLAQLRERPPPNWKSRNSTAVVPTVGSIVLIKDNAPRCRWKIGRVNAIEYSKDGACRSVTVRLPSGTRIKRAVNYLYPLETDSGAKELPSSDSEVSHSTQPKTSRSNHPRHAAIQARESIRTQLLNPPSDEVISCIDNFIQKFMKIFVGSTSPLSRYFVQSRGVSFGSGEAFSIEQMHWYLQLKQHGFDFDASSLLRNQSLRNTPHTIADWCKIRLGNRRFADSIFGERDVYMSVMVYLLRHRNNAFHTEVMRLVDEYGKSTSQDPFQFIVTSGSAGDSYVWTCGLRTSMAQRSKSQHLFPGYSILGLLLGQIFYQFISGNCKPKFNMDLLMSERVFTQQDYRKTVLLLSDSQSSQLRGVYGGDIIPISGGRYHTLVSAVRKYGYRFQDYKIVIISCGVNVAKHPPSTWYKSWAPLKHMLRAVKMYPKTTVILNSAIDTHKINGVPEHTAWVKQEYQSLHAPEQFKFCDWSDKTDEANTFFNNGVMNPIFLTPDQLHVNHRGFRLFWNQWCLLAPQLRYIYYGVGSKKYPNNN